MITILGKAGCSYCVQAMEILDHCEIEYQYTSIDENESARAFFDEKGFGTVPQIWDGDIYIGGYVELEIYLLDKL